MASRDYKDKGGPARGGRGAAPKRGSPMIVGVAIGLLLGLAAALGVAVYINKGPSPFTDRRQAAPPGAPETAANPPAKPDAADKPAPAPGAAQKPGTKAAAPGKSPAGQGASTDTKDLDFYRILEGKEKKAGNPPAPGAPGTKRNLYLQAGAFSSAAEADDLKAKLALAGIEARIQPVRLSPGARLVHRVRLGPFNAEEAELARNRLKQNKVDAIFVQ